MATLLENHSLLKERPDMLLVEVYHTSIKYEPRPPRRSRNGWSVILSHCNWQPRGREIQIRQTRVRSPSPDSRFNFVEEEIVTRREHHTICFALERWLIVYSIWENGKQKQCRAGIRGLGCHSIVRYGKFTQIKAALFTKYTPSPFNGGFQNCLKKCLYLRSLQYHRTSEAPKINPMSESKFETPNLKDDLWLCDIPLNNSLTHRANVFMAYNEESASLLEQRDD